MPSVFLSRRPGSCRDDQPPVLCDVHPDATKPVQVMTADDLTSARELDCRWTNRIQVRLLWRQLDGRLAVAVLDTAYSRVDGDFGDRPEVASETDRQDEPGATP